MAEARTTAAYNVGYEAGKQGRAPSCFPTYYGSGVEKKMQAAFVRGYVKGQLDTKKKSQSAFICK